VTQLHNYNSKNLLFS